MPRGREPLPVSDWPRRGVRGALPDHLDYLRSGVGRRGAIVFLFGALGWLTEALRPACTRLAPMEASRPLDTPRRGLADTGTSGTSRLPLAERVDDLQTAALEGVTARMPGCETCVASLRCGRAQAGMSARNPCPP